MAFETKEEIAKNWLPRYTGMELEEFGEYILLTNFHQYLDMFAERFGIEIKGKTSPMQAATNLDGITMINFGMGSANAATIMDLLVAVKPKAVLLLGKCGGLKKATEIGNYILPIAAIRGDGTSDDYMLKEVPALPSFKLHKVVSNKIEEHGYEYRTGVLYTTNRRVWEWDTNFKEYLKKVYAIGIDMETATIFSVGHVNKIPRGALLLVSDLPMMENGIKTRESDKKVSKEFVDMHLQIGIEAITELKVNNEFIKHYVY